MALTGCLKPFQPKGHCPQFSASSAAKGSEKRKKKKSQSHLCCSAQREHFNKLNACFFKSNSNCVWLHFSLIGLPFHLLKELQWKMKTDTGFKVKKLIWIKNSLNQTSFSVCVQTYPLNHLSHWIFLLVLIQSNCRLFFRHWCTQEDIGHKVVNTHGCFTDQTGYFINATHPAT